MATSLSLKEAKGSTFVDNEAEWTLKIRRFANKTIDLIAQPIRHRIPELHKENITGEIIMHPKTLDAHEERLKLLDSQRRARQRAEQMVQFAVRQIDADHMITLTTRDCISDRDVFFKVFSKFIKLVRYNDLINGRLVERYTKIAPFSNPKKDPRDFKFVAVPELQKRGAYHMHIGVTGKQDIPLLRACWYVALGGSISDKGENVLGAINVTHAEKRFADASPHMKKMKLVNYLVKYISKTFEEDESLGIHRYTKSRGIPKPQASRYYLNSCFYLGTGDFINIIMETIEHAKVLGVGNDYSIFNRGEEFFILRGQLEDWAAEGLPF